MAPSIGLWVFERGGWTLLCIEAMVLNMVMAVIAWRLPTDAACRRHEAIAAPADMVEWRVLVLAA